MRDPITRQIWVDRATWVVERELGIEARVADRRSAAPSSGIVFTAPGRAPRFLALRGWDLPSGSRWATLPAATLVDWFHRAQPVAGGEAPPAPERVAARDADDTPAPPEADGPAAPPPMWARFMVAPETDAGE